MTEATADPSRASGTAAPPEREGRLNPGGTEPADDTAFIDTDWLGQIASRDGLFVTDERQRIRAWSPAAQRLLGYTADQAIGQLCYEVVLGRHPEGHPVCTTSCPVTRNARRGRGTAAYDVLAQASDGEPRYLTSNVLVVKGPRGAFRVIHMLRELDERPPCRPSEVERDEDAPTAEALTRRELEVLRLFARGEEPDAIAAELRISPFTVRNHSTTIQHKLGARNRLAMVLEGMRRGLV